MSIHVRIYLQKIVYYTVWTKLVRMEKEQMKTVFTIDQDLIDKWTEYAKNNDLKFHREYGFLAEDVIYRSRGLPEKDLNHMVKDKGWDYKNEAGQKIDIKCTNRQRFSEFQFTDAFWTIRDHFEDPEIEEPDYYLFTKIDIDAKKLVVIGYMPFEEAIHKSTFIEEGTYMTEYRRPSDYDLYIIYHHQIPTEYRFQFEE